jgi:hypothetical protein
MPGMMKRPMYKDGKKVLKPVKPSQKGLKKLPKKVRNKMGYMKDGGRAKWLNFVQKVKRQQRENSKCTLRRMQTCMVQLFALVK